MPNIKPISDLENYNNVLNDVAIDEPVFLTKDGRGKFAIMDIKEYEKLKASLKLMSKLAEGENVASEQGWMNINELENALGV